ncbi:MAG: hypothetical protein ACIALR_08570 [Blastopirellula sp. JB062]
MSRSSRNAAPTRFGLADPLGRQLWICALMLVSFGVGTYALSRSITADTDSDLYRVTPERVAFSTPPAWISEGVLQQVVEYLFREDQPLDIRDREITQRVAELVEAAENPWIKSVQRVVKYYPTKIMVDLQYRQPVALVEIKAKIGDADRALVPIDVEGVILPGSGNAFLEQNLAQFPRINVGGTLPEADRKPGDPWGDQRVADAAKIAAALGNVWTRLKLYRVVAVAGEGEGGLFELHTHEGAHLIWGSAPGAELPHENSAAQKIGMLLALQEAQIAAGQIDLRTPAELSATAAPAAR